ncbi:EstA family serine hydrolase [Bacillus pseudomycoides]|uniref:serine hydrolase domain-containing protein n=1 Tax=Bacillus pseudomycoides TaxID=64104 RepID=UPI000BF9E748|nr:serine hydrolase domain-containing protein [Bacillus pseudomycoides]PGC28717.1 EstA family serine hydrolase [Bacillus pseudomycoides]
MEQTIHIDGFVKPGFEKVKHAFIENFTNHEELGAACCIYYNGERVVDLWGEYRDHHTKELWQADTAVLIFSGTKGFASLALALAHSKGYIDYEEKVSTYWNEFGANGKENITVRQLLGHQAGLCCINKLPLHTLRDFDTKHVAPYLETMKPAWEPGTRHGYHTWTIGWYISELIRHVDPKGRNLTRFFNEEIAQPLQAEMYIGIPTSLPNERIATIKGIQSIFDIFKSFGSFPKSLLWAFMNPKSLAKRSMVDPKGLLAHDNFNKRELREIEFPSGNGIGVVRDMAKIYSEFATGGPILGLSSFTLDELSKPPLQTNAGWRDAVQTVDTAFSLGFFKPLETGSYYGNFSYFGHPGAGGSLCFADPINRVGFSYAMTRVGMQMFDDPRETAIRKAFYETIS